MCGICGFAWDRSRRAPRPAEETIAGMTETLVHRGPDTGGTWVDGRIGVALGHRRLSILDLTAEGNQPMTSPSGRYVVVYNGEIYNFRDLRAEIDGGGSGGAVAWRGTSDTEVLLAAFERWGFEATLRRTVGMFALALLDRAGPALYLARDRFGEKPLYYGVAGAAFLFASELKAFHAHPGFVPEIDRDALAMYLRRNYVPAPFSIFRGVRKLPPAAFVKVDLRGDAPPRDAAPVPYWSVLDAALAGKADPFRGSEAEAVEELDRVLRRTVRDQKVADVPLGAFLSGGIDSSTVVSLLQAESDRPVRTFTVGFEEDAYSEAAQAAAVARHLGTDHTGLLLTSREALETVPRIATLYDEPFADCSQVPTFLVARLARSRVTVGLTGDGGDELFAGYNRHFHIPALWRRLRRLRPSLRGRAAAAIRRISPESWDRIFRGIYAFLPERSRQRVPGDQVLKLAGILDSGSPEEMYLKVVSHWRDPAAVAVDAAEPHSLLTGPELWPRELDFAEWMLYMDQSTYLPDDILVKSDRAAMGVSLESRMPFLDHRVAEFSWRLPMGMKVRGGEGKRILKALLGRYVPARLTDRKKTGFGMPIGAWLRGPMRDWAESYLGEDRLRQEGYLAPAPVRAAWAAHLSGTENRQYEVWNVLMFQAWLEAGRRRR